MMMILIQAMHGIPYEPFLKRCLALEQKIAFTSCAERLANISCGLYVR